MVDDAIPGPGRNARNSPGRPRSRAVDQAILRAALELFIDHGVEGASIEKIARRAGVAKTSIYRRWPSREALLAQAVEVARNAAGPTIEVIDQASPHDMINLLVNVSEVAARPEIRKLMARLMGSVPDRPQLMNVYRETYYLPRRRAVTRALERVQAAGLLRPDTDIEALVDMILGALAHHLLAGAPGTVTAAELRAYLIRILRQAGFDISEIAPR